MNWKPIRAVIVGAGVFFILGIAGAIQAAPGDPGARRIQGMTPQKRREIIKRLNLTDAQRQTIKQRKATFRKRIVELKNDIALKGVERDNELEKVNPDKAKVRRLTDEIGALKGQLVQEDNNHQVEFEKLLTPAQLEQWRAILKERASSTADVDAAAE